MSNVTITNNGLSFVASASNGGPLVQIQYFVPSYDFRIDPYIRTGGALSAISAVAAQTVSATTPFGEIIWQTPGYTMSNPGQYIISAANLTQHYQGVSQPINLHNGVPLTNSISGTSLSSIPNGNNYSWTIAGLGSVSGNDTFSTTKYNTGDYYPVTTSGTGLVGAFRCDVQLNNGPFKFNKLDLYAAQIHSDGTPTGNTCFFAEAYLAQPIVKQGLSQNGYDDITMIVQIQLQSASATFGSVFYSSSGDYWAQSPGGLYYPNRVGIGSFDYNVLPISASLQVRRSRDLSGNPGDPTIIPQLKIDYDNTHSLSVAVLSSTSDGNTDSGGDILLTQYFCGSNRYNAIYTTSASTMTLGKTGNEFKEIFVSNSTGPGMAVSGTPYAIVTEGSIIPVNTGLTYSDIGTPTIPYNNGYFGNLSASNIIGTNLSASNVTVTTNINTPSAHITNLSATGISATTLMTTGNVNINDGMTVNNGITVDVLNPAANYTISAYASLIPYLSGVILGTSDNPWYSVATSNGYNEFARPFQMGQWITFSSSADVFSGSLSGSPDSGTITPLYGTIIGKTAIMTLSANWNGNHSFGWDAAFDTTKPWAPNWSFCNSNVIFIPSLTSTTVALNTTKNALEWYSHDNISGPLLVQITYAVN